MDKKQAFAIIMEALNIAQKKGTFENLQDAAVIHSALQVLGEEFKETKPGVESLDKTVAERSTKAKSGKK